MESCFIGTASMRSGPVLSTPLAAGMQTISHVIAMGYRRAFPLRVHPDVHLSGLLRVQVQARMFL